MMMQNTRINNISLVLAFTLICFIIFLIPLLLNYKYLGNLAISKPRLWGCEVPRHRAILDDTFGIYLLQFIFQSPCCGVGNLVITTLFE
jgi:hypothetical protein